MSRLKILAPAGAILLLFAWILLKDALALAIQPAGATAPGPAPDYADPASWLSAPETPPPSLWEEGWDIDLFLLPALAKAWQAPGIIDPAAADYRAEQAETVAALMPALAATGPVYSPALRLPSPASVPGDWSPAASDLGAAIGHYFDTLNRGRALAILVPDGDQPLAGALKAALAGRSEIEQARIVAVIALGGADERVASPLAGCAYGPDCPLALPVSQAPDLLARLRPQPPGGVHPFRLDAPEAFGAELTALRADWLDRLEDGVPRPAEPLGGFETIEIAPVYTPDGERIDQ